MDMFELCFIGAAYLMGLATALSGFTMMLGQEKGNGGCFFRWLALMCMGAAAFLVFWGIFRV